MTRRELPLGSVPERGTGTTKTEGGGWQAVVDAPRGSCLAPLCKPMRFSARDKRCPNRVNSSSFPLEVGVAGMQRRCLAGTKNAGPCLVASLFESCIHLQQLPVPAVVDDDNIAHISPRTSTIKVGTLCLQHHQLERSYYSISSLEPTFPPLPTFRSVQLAWINNIDRPVPRDSQSPLPSPEIPIANAQPRRLKLATI